VSSYIECNRCVMSNAADPNITFNKDGICSHCQRYDNLVDTRIARPETRNQEFKALIEKIKQDGRGNEYDCLVGVSGGVDSTYVAYLAKIQGLRPLAVHFDNGWDSELAVKNIQQVLNRLNIDLVTYVVDWEEFRDLQVSFLKASVPDGEIPTDHGIDALVWRQASKYNIKYILSGMNFATESIFVSSWAYGHSDWKYISSIHAKFGSKKLRSFPHFNFLYLFYVNLIRSIRIISLLNYVNYNKNETKAFLCKELGWVDYGGKHFESIYTRFFQGVVLPQKFGIDKRIGHLSDLINAGQISKADAKEELISATYDPILQRQDRSYVIKKLGLTEDQYEELMARPIKSYRDYPNSYSLVQFLRNGVNVLRRYGFYPK
jgi:N-acetyl sugar amidotransferase